jgi:hypothetical protein
MRKQEIIGEIICSLLVLLFVYAAVSKLIDFQKFRVQLGQSPLITSLAGFFVWLVPAVEILVAVSLANSRLRLPGLYASFCLLTMFSAYIVAITHFSEFIPCSCGGLLQKMSWNEHLAFNCCFIILNIIAIILFTKNDKRSVVIT